MGRCLSKNGILNPSHVRWKSSAVQYAEKIRCRYNAPIAGSFSGEEVATDDNPTVPSLFHSHGGKAWVSNLTVQGDGQSPCGALVVYSAAQLQFIGAPHSHYVLLRDNSYGQK